MDQSQGISQTSTITGLEATSNLDNKKVLIDNTREMFKHLSEYMKSELEGKEIIKCRILVYLIIVYSIK